MARCAVVSLLAAGGVGVMGCSRQTNRLPAQTAAAASTSAALYVPQGPFPRGQAGPGSAPGPQGPELSLVAPARGAQLGGASAAVEVEARDPDGVQALTIDGQPAQDLGGGRWGATVSLQPGLNVVRVEARDGAGTASRSAFSLLQGRFLAPGSEVPGACAARLGQGALDLLAGKIEAAAAGLDLLALVQQTGQPLVNSALIKVDVTSIAHAPPRVARLTPATGGLEAALEIDALQVELEVDLVGRGVVYVSANRARLDLLATINPASGPATGAGLLGLDLTRLDLSFQGLALQARNPAADLLLTPFKGLILTAVQVALERALRRAAPGLLARPLPGVDAPVTIQVPVLEGGTRPLELSGRLLGGRGWPGVALDLEPALRVAAVQPFHAGTGLGILVGAPPRPAAPGGGVDDVEVALSEDAAAAVAHAYWHAGGARYRLDGTLPTSAKAPLSARLLHPFFPLARDLAPDPATPVVIEASLEAPPLVQLGRPAGTVAFLTPEAQVVVWLDYMDGGPPLELLRARLTLELAVQVDVSGSDLVFTRLRCGKLGLDVIAEPAGDLDDQGIEDFILQALPIVLDALHLPAVPVPALPAGVPLLAPGLEARDGWLFVRGRVR